MKKKYNALEEMQSWFGHGFKLQAIVSILVVVLTSSFIIRIDSDQVRSIQTERTKLLARLLEEGKIDSITPLVGQEYLKKDTSLISKLKWASSEIQKDSFYRTPILDAKWQWKYEDDMNYNTFYYYRLHDTLGPFLEVTMYYEDMDASAVLRKLKFKNQVEIAAEQKRIRQGMRDK